jgi:hypothetical protein
MCFNFAMRWSARLLWIMGTVFVVSLAMMILGVHSYIVNRGNVSSSHTDLSAQAYIASVIQSDQAKVLSFKADQILFKLHGVCSDLRLKFIGPIYFQPTWGWIDQDTSGVLSITGTTMRLASMAHRFTFRQEDNRLTDYTNSLLSDLMYGHDAPLYDQPDVPKWSVDQAIQIAAAFRNILVDPTAATLGKPSARYVHTARQGPKSYVGEWMVSWPRVDSQGHPFYGDHITIQIPEGYEPLGAGIDLTTPFVEEKGKPMAESKALANARSNITWTRSAEEKLAAALSHDDYDTIVDHKVIGANLMIVIPHWRSWGDFFAARSSPSARLAWIFWFEPIHKGKPSSPTYDDRFAVWIDAYTGDVIGGDAML